MVDGVLYLSTPGSRVVALDADTGRQLWTFDPGLDRSAQSLITSRGVSVWLDPERADGDPCRRRVFLAALDARLFALDAHGGAPCADFGHGGVVDLGPGVLRVEGRREDYQETAPPAVVHDLVIVGSKISDSKVADAPSGVVRAFDARTGALRWSWEPLPGVGGLSEAGEFVPAGAANAWATLTVDAARDLVFVPTGSASPDHWGGLRPGRQPVRELPGRAARVDGREGLALPGGPARPVGLRHPGAGRARHGAARRAGDPRRRPGHEDGLRLRPRPRDGRAALPGRRAPRARERRAGRESSRRPSRSPSSRGPWLPSGSRPTTPGASRRSTASRAVGRSRGSAPKGSSLPRACGAPSSTRGSSAGWSGAGWPSTRPRACS